MNTLTQKIDSFPKEELLKLINNKLSKTKILQKILNIDYKPSAFLIKVLNKKMESDNLFMAKNYTKTSVIWKLDQNLFLLIIENSYSINEALNFFNLQNKSANYETLFSRMEDLGLSIDKFKNKCNEVTKIKRKQASFEEIFSEDSSICRSSVKSFILKHKLIEEKCAGCGLTHWKSAVTNNVLKKIPLTLDHINGINNDNTLEGYFENDKFVITKTNLRFLCGTCDTLSPFYGGKNTKNTRGFVPTKEFILKKIEENKLKYSIKLDKKYCIQCSKEIFKKSVNDLCINCLIENKNEKHKSEEPFYKELFKQVEIEGTLKNAAKSLSISTSCLKKRFKKFGLKIKLLSNFEDKIKVLESIDFKNDYPKRDSLAWKHIDYLRYQFNKNQLKYCEIYILNSISKYILSSKEKENDIWIEKYEKVKNWIQLNKRLPKKHSSSNEEVSFAKWLKKIDKLNDEQIDKINSLLSLNKA